MFKHDLPEMVEGVSASASRPAFDQLSTRRRLLILLLLTALIYVGSAWNPSLQDDADAAHAEAAREIVERGDWVTLHINGVRYLEKAPLMYWAVALSYKVFGSNEFATRFPLAIGAMLLVAAVYYFGLWMGGGRAGVYSGLAMCTGLGVYLFTRIMIPEVIIAFFLTAAFYFFLKLDTQMKPLALVERLIKEYGVAAIPGDAFGMENGCYLRVAYGALRPETVAEGVGRLARGMREILDS